MTYTASRTVQSRWRVLALRNVRAQFVVAGLDVTGVHQRPGLIIAAPVAAAVGQAPGIRDGNPDGVQSQPLKGVE
jgi:hypothetical protein